jgi:hypothetical protein
MSALTDQLPGWFKRKGPPTGEESETTMDSAENDPATASVTTGGGSSQEPVVVWEAANLMEAEVIKSRLESEGIPTLLRGEALGTIYGLTAGGLARTSVLVPAVLADQALEILAPDELSEEMDDGEPDAMEDSETGESAERD